MINIFINLLGQNNSSKYIFYFSLFLKDGSDFTSNFPIFRFQIHLSSCSMILFDAGKLVYIITWTLSSHTCLRSWIPRMPWTLLLLISLATLAFFSLEMENICYPWPQRCMTKVWCHKLILPPLPANMLNFLSKSSHPFIISLRRTELYGQL